MAAIIVGICGGTGAGKSTLARRIMDGLSKGSSVLVEQDHYYKDLPHLTLEARARHNFDHPDAIDFPLMTEHIRQLLSGRAIERPIYDFARHVRENQTVLLQPGPVVVVEGTLILENKELSALLDVKIFLDTDADVRFIRRLRRDMRERGRTVDSIIEQYLATVYPMHKRFIEPSKALADLIIASESDKDVEGLIQKVFATVPVPAGPSARTALEARSGEGPAGPSDLPQQWSPLKSSTPAGNRGSIRFI